MVAQERKMDDMQLDVVAERFERRLSEAAGQLRVEISGLRAEMIHRNAELLKWLLGFFVAQTAALGALMSILR